MNEFDLFLEIYPVNQNKQIGKILTLEGCYEAKISFSFLENFEKIAIARWLTSYFLDHYATPADFTFCGDFYNRNRNYEKACQVLKRAPQDQKANLLLAEMYAEGKVGRVDGKPNMEEVARLYRQVNTPETLLKLKDLYLQGVIGVDENGRPNYAEVAKIYTQINTPEALTQLGTMYESQLIGVKDGKPDYAEAARLFRLANIPLSMCMLGTLYHRGLITNSDGIDRYESAAQCYECANIDIAHDLLANLYETGRIRLKDGKPDFAAAIKHYQASGSPEAFYNIGVIYLQGDTEQIEGRPNYVKAYCSFKLSKDIKAKSMQLEMVEDYSEEIEKCFQSKSKAEIITDVLTQLQGRLNTASLCDQEFILGLSSYHLKKDLNQALIHFNNAWVLGHEFAERKVLMLEIKLFMDKFKGNQMAEREEKPSLPSATTTEPASTEPLVKSPLSEPSVDSTKREKKPKEDGSDTEKPKAFKPEKALQSREERIKATFAKINNKMMSDDLKSGNPKGKLESSHPLKINFIDSATESAFHSLNEKKMAEMLSYVQAKPFGTDGTGKPEVLKGIYMGYKGCISRRIDHENRFIYKVTGPHEILVLSCQGHYEK
jgi:Txe/YoeB family toxin of toxin-antitoxin system